MNKEFKRIKIAISCGGTGGHFYPGLSIARKVNQMGGVAILLLAGKNAEQQKKIAESVNVQAYVLPIISSLTLKSVHKFIKGVLTGSIMSRKILKENKINVVLGMGSFTSFPPVVAAKSLRLPLFLHDGNARIGKANRYFSWIAKKLWSAFDMVNAKKLHCPNECIGMPLRPEITDIEKISKGEAIDKLNSSFGSKLISNRVTFLIFGGSQGAEIFNVELPKSLKELSKVYEFQVIHLTGKGKIDYTRELYQDANFPVLLLESSEKMELFYQASDLVVSRSGGSSIAEIAFFGKASILVPYPYAAENHQYDNACYLAENGAAIVLDNKNCDHEAIIQNIDKLLGNPKELKKMSEGAYKKAKVNVAEKIIEEICTILDL